MMRIEGGASGFDMDLEVATSSISTETQNWKITIRAQDLFRRVQLTLSQ
jgi:hypothetical protein